MDYGYQLYVLKIVYYVDELAISNSGANNRQLSYDDLDASLSVER